jgi:hypothetical protein
VILLVADVKELSWVLQVLLCPPGRLTGRLCEKLDLEHPAELLQVCYNDLTERMQDTTRSLCLRESTKQLQSLKHFIMGAPVGTTESLLLFVFLSLLPLQL